MARRKKAVAKKRTTRRRRMSGTKADAMQAIKNIALVIGGHVVGQLAKNAIDKADKTGKLKPEVKGLIIVGIGAAGYMLGKEPMIKSASLGFATAGAGALFLKLGIKGLVGQAPKVIYLPESMMRNRVAGITGMVGKGGGIPGFVGANTMNRRERSRRAM